MLATQSPHDASPTRSCLELTVRSTALRTGLTTEAETIQISLYLTTPARNPAPRLGTNTHMPPLPLDEDRPRTEQERRERALESKRKWAAKRRYVALSSFRLLTLSACKVAGEVTWLLKTDISSHV